MTDKEKTRLWAKGRLFEVMNGIGEQDAKSVLTDLLAFIGSDLESDLTHSVTKISDQQIPISDDIEKEADICWDYVFSALGWNENSLMTMNHKEFLAFASHFAEWQKKCMMKNACKCAIAKESIDFQGEGHTIWIKVNTDDFHIEDEIKIIIIKKD